MHNPVIKKEIYSNGNVKHGHKIEVGCTMYMKDCTEDIKAILENTQQEEIIVLIETYKQREDKLLAKYKELLATEYGELAYQTQLYKSALEASRASLLKAKHTNNQWVVNEHDNETISNATFVMSIHMYEHTHYDRELKQSVADAWYVSWSLRTNSPINEYSTGHTNETIASQDKKRFTDKTKALQYITGRKKAYADYFTAEYPPIPKKYAKCFSKNGVLLPNYKVAD